MEMPQTERVRHGHKYAGGGEGHEGKTYSNRILIAYILCQEGHLKITIEGRIEGNDALHRPRKVYVACYIVFTAQYQMEIHSIN